MPRSRSCARSGDTPARAGAALASRQRVTVRSARGSGVRWIPIRARPDAGRPFNYGSGDGDVARRSSTQIADSRPTTRRSRRGRQHARHDRDRPLRRGVSRDGSLRAQGQRRRGRHLLLGPEGRRLRKGTRLPERPLAADRLGAARRSVRRAERSTFRRCRSRPADAKISSARLSGPRGAERLAGRAAADLSLRRERAAPSHGG